MSNSKHTPGKWEQYFNLVKSENGENICLVNTGPKQISEALANAAIIAAAPEMMEALEKCESYIHDLEAENFSDLSAGIQADNDLSIAYSLMKAAIKKAKGE